MASSNFEQFVAQRSPSLLRASWLLTGEEQAARDLLQEALLRTWRRWDKLRDPSRADAYVRKAMVTTLISWRRRRSYGERPVADVPEQAFEAVDVDTRDSVLEALGGLSGRQRAVVVLRFFLDLSEAETAKTLGCSVGAVKSHNARAMQTLRGNPTIQQLRQPEVPT